MWAFSSSLITTFDLLELRKFMTAQVKCLGLVDTSIYQELRIYPYI